MQTPLAFSLETFIMRLQWSMCGDEDDPHWCSFRKVKLPPLDTVFGVYVIWMEDEDVGYVAVRVGQGDIYDRIASHRRDEDIKELEDKANAILHVTWAEVPESFRDGVEKFLSDELDPLIGRRFPDVRPVPVNLPGPLR